MSGDPKLAGTHTLCLRPAVAGDAMAVARLIDRAFALQLAGELQGPARVAFGMHVTGSGIRRRLLAGAVAVLATDNGEAGGYAELCDRRHGGPGHDHLALFFVDPDRQRRGLGRALLQAALDRILEADQAPAALSVNSSRYAEPIYRRLGFTIESGDTGRADPFSIPMRLSIGRRRSV